jgi:hypothetical protein
MWQVQQGELLMVGLTMKYVVVVGMYFAFRD